MPTYDYECSACGHTFEHFQSMSSNKLRTCPKCKKKKLERHFGIGSGVIFKGSGFYETDYKRAGKAGTDKTDAADAKSEKTTKEATPSGSGSASAKKDGGSKAGEAKKSTSGD